MNESHFWFIHSLERSDTEVDWSGVMDNATSFLDSEQRRTVMNIAALNGLNPMLVITNLTLEGTWPVNENGTALLPLFGRTLLDLELHYELVIESGNVLPKRSPPTSALWRVLGQNDTKLDEFVTKFDDLMQAHGITSRSLSKRRTEFDIRTTGNSSEKEYKDVVREKMIDLNMIWPWEDDANIYCWDIGATHAHTQDCEYCYPKSAIDMGPDIKGDWCENKTMAGCDDPCSMETCPQNFPYVVASHDGIVSRYPSLTSACSVKILNEATGLSTWYGHMDGIMVYAGENVVKGQRIGRIAQSKSQADCDTSIAHNGPHLHFSMWFDETKGVDKPLDMSHVVIEDITFKTGIEDYDINCTACDSGCASKLVSDFSGSYCPWTPERGSNFGKVLMFIN